MNIAPEQLPIHQVTVVGIAIATETPMINEFGVQVESTITDYFSKDKLVDILVTLFHPPGSQFVNQTTTIKRGSCVFFSGALTIVESKLYIELHNFSFVRIQSNTSSQNQKMPWSSGSAAKSSSTTSIVQSIHNFNNKKKQSTSTSNSPIPFHITHKKSDPIIQESDTDNSKITEITEVADNLKKTSKNPPTPKNKRKAQSSDKTNYRTQKPAEVPGDSAEETLKDPPTRTYYQKQKKNPIF